MVFQLPRPTGAGRADRGGHSRGLGDGRPGLHSVGCSDSGNVCMYIYIYNNI